MLCLHLEAGYLGELMGEFVDIYWVSHQCFSSFAPSISFSPLHFLILFLDRHFYIYMCHASINGTRVIEQELSFGPDLLRQKT